MPRAVLLELDGVLVDVAGARAAALAAALAAEGVAPRNGAPASWLAPFDDLAGTLAAGTTDATTLALVALRAEDEYAGRVAAGVTLAPGVHAAVAQLAVEWRVGVVTMCRRADAERVLALAGLAAAVRFVAAADDGPPFPPHAERVRRALARLRPPEAPPDAVAAVVASPTALQAARAAGARTVLVPSAASAADVLERLATLDRHAHR